MQRRSARIGILRGVPIDRGFKRHRDAPERCRIRTRRARWRHHPGANSTNSFLGVRCVLLRPR
jgi:hypothetical protein